MLVNQVEETEVEAVVVVVETIEVDVEMDAQVADVETDVLEEDQVETAVVVEIVIEDQVVQKVIKVENQIVSEMLEMVTMQEEENHQENNKLKTIPRGVCYLKNLTSINLVGNNIESLPDELGKLDRKNGGGLIRIAFGKKEVSKEILAKARRLLPTTEIVEFDNTKG